MTIFAFIPGKTYIDSGFAGCIDYRTFQSDPVSGITGIGIEEEHAFALVRVAVGAIELHTMVSVGVVLPGLFTMLVVQYSGNVSPLNPSDISVWGGHVCAFNAKNAATTKAKDRITFFIYT